MAYNINDLQAAVENALDIAEVCAPCAKSHTAHEMLTEVLSLLRKD